MKISTTRDFTKLRAPILLISLLRYYFSLSLLLCETATVSRDSDMAAKLITMTRSYHGEGVAR